MSAQPDPRRWKALALLCVAVFMVILDAQIVILALPSIEADLGFSPGDAQWVISAYLLSFGGLMLLGGRSADLLGPRRMFLIGTGLFLAASLLCGLAWSAAVLIAARVLLGISAAIMAPTALSLLMTTFAEGPERNRALGIWSAVGGAGATAALLLGGPVTDGLGWEWIFFLNVPVALGLLALTPLLLRERHERMFTRAYDVPGAVTITAALVLLVYAVVDAPEVGWGSARTIALLTVSVALVALFAIIERRSASPLVPLRILASRSLLGGNLVLLALGMAAFGMSLIVSLYAQQVLGLSALEFGLGTAVMTATTVVGSTAGQAMVTRVGFRPVAVAGLFLTAVGSLVLTQVSVGGSYWGDIFLALLIFGPGLGAAYVAASIAALSGVVEQESGLASALNNVAFQVGGALGTAAVTTVALSQAHGPDALSALTAGYQAGFGATTAFAAIGVVAAMLLLAPRRARAVPEPAAT